MSDNHGFTRRAATKHSRGWSQCGICGGYCEWKQGEAERFIHEPGCPLGKAEAEIARLRAELEKR
jgi:hypothetical protein